MDLKQFSAATLATWAMLVVSALSNQASGQQSELTTAGASKETIFTGGATINGGVSYLPVVPASEPADLIVTMHPAPADVGQEADIYVIVRAPGQGFFQKTDDGVWQPLDLENLDSLRPYATKELGITERIEIIDNLVGEDVNLAGVTLSGHVAYATGGSLGTLTWNDVSAPALLTIAQSAADSCPANTYPAIEGSTFKNKPVCVLEGRITTDTHLTSNFSYLLNGGVFIGENDFSGGAKTRLTIDAGTYVFGEQSLNFLVIDRGGEIHANGSRGKPIVFTYEFEDEADEFTTGQWGGLILNGNAPINVSGGVAEGEGDTGEFGGADSEDSSGVLTFVQVKYAGQNITESNELNGIAFQGTGSGTLVDYIQVHNNSDDGIEFFGGTTNARHILLTGNEDDALDWTFGWRGKVQFVAIVQNSAGEHCIEADNYDADNDALPRSRPTISNLTCNGAPDEDISGLEGIKLREGTSANLSNFVLGGFGVYCVDIDHAATFAAAGGSIAELDGSLTLRHSRLDASCSLEDEAGDPFTVTDWFSAQTGSMLGGVDLGGESGLVNGPRLNAVEPAIPDDDFFQQVDHIGAVKSADSDWTTGWSHFD